VSTRRKSDGVEKRKQVEARWTQKRTRTPERSSSRYCCEGSAERPLGALVRERGAKSDRRKLSNHKRTIATRMVCKRNPIKHSRQQKGMGAALPGYAWSHCTARHIQHAPKVTLTTPLVRSEFWCVLHAPATNLTAGAHMVLCGRCASRTGSQP